MRNNYCVERGLIEERDIKILEELISDLENFDDAKNSVLLDFFVGSQNQITQGIKGFIDKGYSLEKIEVDVPDKRVSYTIKSPFGNEFTFYSAKNSNKIFKNIFFDKNDPCVMQYYLSCFKKELEEENFYSDKEFVKA